VQRRLFLTSALCLTALHGSRLRAQRTGNGQIDVHHHVFPPRLRAALDGKIPPRFLPGEDDSLREMDASGTTHAVISFPNSDITTMEREALADLVRACNDHAVGVVAKHPNRYRLFASLPMPYVDASLSELDRIGKEVPAEGILLISNYGKRWLGDPEFSPLMQEINRRRLMIYVHPNAADCCRGLLPGVSDSIVEFQTDTSRTIGSLLFSGSAQRFSSTRFLFSHSGGTLPSLIERFVSAPKASPGLDRMMPQGALWYLRRFYYDTAQTANPSALGALLKIVPDTQVMFGSDFPYRTAAEQVSQLKDMDLGERTLQRILSGNAQQVLRFA
jgi:predicted TIM-barrel fold metal-dependent hydrolase